MFLERDDIIKFYELSKHYNPLSTNIGIIGDAKYITNKIKSIKKATPYNIFIQDDTQLRYRFIYDDMETTYYGIQTLDDLAQLYFRKYI